MGEMFPQPEAGSDGAPSSAAPNDGH